MKKVIKIIKKFILPGAFLVGLLFVASLAQALAPTGDLGGGGLPTLHYRASTSVNGTPGTISPTYQDVLPGATATFSVVPASGYMAEYTGSSTQSACIGSYSGTTYTTAPINNDCTLDVTFVLKPPVVISFYPVNAKVNMGTKPTLKWDVTGTNHCWVKGSDGYASPINITTNHPNVGLQVKAISTPTTYTLKCTTDPIGTTPSPVTAYACIGTVVGSIGTNGVAPGPYEGQSCLQFTTQSTCLQGWLTHGCSWSSL